MRTRAVDTALIDLAGRTVASRRLDVTDGMDIPVVVDAVRELAQGFEPRILAACVQVPGVTAGGVVVESVQLGWYGVPIASILEEAIGAPTSVVNDVDAEALTEAVDAEDGEIRLVVHLGEGVGAAVTNGGALMSGATGRAGEIGHVRVVFEGARATCRCGLSGCLESATSMSAMLGDAYTDELDNHDTSLLASTAESRERMGFGARALSRALRIISALLDPHEIIIAGAAPALGATSSERCGMNSRCIRRRARPQCRSVTDAPNSAGTSGRHGLRSRRSSATRSRSPTRRSTADAAWRPDEA